MAKVKIQGHASGTGILTVTAPNTSTDRTITLPDATGNLLASEGAVTINDSGADVDFRVESDNKTHALFIDGANGNVGINTTPAAWAGTIAPIQLGNRSAVAETDNMSMNLFQNAYFDGSSYKYINTDTALQIQMNGSANDIRFRTAASGSADATISFTERLKITDDGRGLSQFTAKAWCNFNGTGTIAINDSHNVSSLTDVNTGNWNVNLTNALGNANYACVADSDITYTDETTHSHTETDQVVKVRHIRHSIENYTDKDELHLIVFGD